VTFSSADRDPLEINLARVLEATFINRLKKEVWLELKLLHANGNQDADLLRVFKQAFYLLVPLFRQISHC